MMGGIAINQGYPSCNHTILLEYSPTNKVGENTGVLEDIRFTSDQIMYDTLSEGKRNNNNKLRDRQEIRRSRGGGDDRPKPMAWGWSLDAT